MDSNSHEKMDKEAQENGRIRYPAVRRRIPPILIQIPLETASCTANLDQSGTSAMESDKSPLLPSYAECKVRRIPILEKRALLGDNEKEEFSN
jgi:hypothetical protein